MDFPNILGIVCVFGMLYNVQHLTCILCPGAPCYHCIHWSKKIPTQICHWTKRTCITGDSCIYWWVYIVCNSYSADTMKRNLLLTILSLQSPWLTNMYWSKQQDRKHVFYYCHMLHWLYLIVMWNKKFTKIARLLLQANADIICSTVSVNWCKML